MEETVNFVRRKKGLRLISIYTLSRRLKLIYRRAMHALGTLQPRTRNSLVYVAVPYEDYSIVC